MKLCIAIGAYVTMSVSISPTSTSNEPFSYSIWTHTPRESVQAVARKTWAYQQRNTAK